MKPTKLIVPLATVVSLMALAGCHGFGHDDERDRGHEVREGDRHDDRHDNDRHDEHHDNERHDEGREGR
jgi:hypothetical protein